MSACKLTKKTFIIFLHAFVFIFLEYITITFSRLQCFRKYKRKVVIYLFNDDSSKSAFFMLNMAFDILLSTVLVK